MPGPGRQEPAGIPLPPYQDAPLTPVSARFAAYRFAAVLLFWLPVAAVTAGLRLTGQWSGPLHAVAVGALLGLGVVLALLAGREANRRGFALRAGDLIHRAGLFVRRETIIPVRRIQHVEVVTGPLERLLGLARVVCYTAGGASADLVIAGLDPATAARVRDHLLTRIHADTTNGEHAAGAGES